VKVIDASCSEADYKRASIAHFEQTELGAHLNEYVQDRKVPMKYRTLLYVQKILHCKEVEDDIKEFRNTENYTRKNWQYQGMINKDIART
jgi:hypothetical protein